MKACEDALAEYLPDLPTDTPEQLRNVFWFKTAFRCGWAACHNAHLKAQLDALATEEQAP